MDNVAGGMAGVSVLLLGFLGVSFFGGSDYIKVASFNG